MAGPPWLAQLEAKDRELAAVAEDLRSASIRAAAAEGDRARLQEIAHGLEAKLGLAQAEAGSLRGQLQVSVGVRRVRRVGGTHLRPPFPWRARGGSIGEGGGGGAGARPAVGWAKGHAA
jgi:hypothetical protein